jgi:hypothetical protein
MVTYKNVRVEHLAEKAHFRGVQRIIGGEN